jgi:glycosyltransferase involved in cell wall biosynthesis
MTVPPKISIVTPCFNCVDYLGETIDSVLNQAYPNLEYIIIDGKSSDGSADLIKSKSEKLAFWQSKPDEGMYDAINQGFSRSTGEVLGWINSDDKLLPWTLKVVSEIFEQHPDIDWISSRYPLWWSHDGICRGAGKTRIANRHTIKAGWHFPGAKINLGFLQQESTFWRRKLWDKVGGLNKSLRFASDANLWFRMADKADIWLVETPLAGFRYHLGQATNISFTNYLSELNLSCRDGQDCLPFVYRHPILCNHAGRILPIMRYTRKYLRIPVNVLRCDDFRALNPRWIKEIYYEKVIT